MVDVKRFKSGVKINQEKKSEIFSCGAFLSFDADETFIEAPILHETSTALNNSWLRPCSKSCPLTWLVVSFVV